MLFFCKSPLFPLFSYEAAHASQGLGFARLLQLFQVRCGLTCLARIFKVLDQVRDPFIVVVHLPFLLLAGGCTGSSGGSGGGGLAGRHGLVRLGEAAEVGQRVWAELVQDTRDEFGELFGLAGTVDGEGVGREGGVDWKSAGLWNGDTTSLTAK